MSTPIQMPTRPVARYFGGKWRLAPWVISYFSRHEKYVEPYCGAASVLLRKDRTFAEVISDINQDVYNLFIVLRDPALSERLAELCWLTPFSREEFRAAYEPCEEPVERARRFIVRSFMGYNAVSCHRPSQTAFRTRLSDGRFSPAANWAKYPEPLRLVTERLRGVTVESLPALELIRLYDSPDTVIYLDPPYVLSARRKSSHKAYRDEMTEDDHVALATSARAATGMVYLSGYASPLYDHELYPDWHRVECDAVADTGAGAGGAQIARKEVMWINPAGWERRQAEIGQATLFA